MLISGSEPRPGCQHYIHAFNKHFVVLPLWGLLLGGTQSLEYLWLVLESGEEKQTQEASHGWPLGWGRNPIYGTVEFTNIRVF